MVIDNKTLDNLTAQAKASPRLRMNLNFHQSLDEKCHRFLNAVEPGANIPVHRHPEKEETFVVLRGRVRVITYNDDGTIIEDIVLSPSEGRYGVNVGKNVWHTVEALEPGSVLVKDPDEYNPLSLCVLQQTRFTYCRGIIMIRVICYFKKIIPAAKILIFGM